jgi:hypothetical protein
MGNLCWNAQWMFAHLAIYLILLLPLHNTLRLFEYINIFLEVERTFILKLDHMLKKLPLIATDIWCSSTINRYINWPTSYFIFQSLNLLQIILELKKIQKIECCPLVWFQWALGS